MKLLHTKTNENYAEDYSHDLLNHENIMILCSKKVREIKTFFAN